MTAVAVTGVPLDLEQLRKDGRAQLRRQSHRARKYEAYYDGHISASFLSGEQRDIFELLIPASRTNWAELVVNAVAERLLVVGFRFGSEDSNDRAWRIWQASKMDSRAEMVQTDALVCGHSFVSVWPDDSNPTGVQIVPEHPTQTTILHEWHRGQARPVAAYKQVVEDGELVEQIITHDEIVTWRREATTIEDGDGNISYIEGRGREDEGPDDVESHPVGFVPFVEVAPRPRTIGPPRSELHSVTPIVDRIALQTYNRLVASDFGAFRAVTATGITLEQNADGSYKAPFKVGADKVLASSNPNARIAALAESDLRGYLGAVDDDVQHLAAITQTPHQYFGGNTAAEVPRAVLSGLVSKVRLRAAHIGQAHEDSMRMGLRIIGDRAADDVAAETIWRDFETRSEGETVDALVKMRTLNIAYEVLQERWGMTPQEIERNKQLRSEETAIEAASAASALGAADPYVALLAQTGGRTSPPPQT